MPGTAPPLPPKSYRWPPQKKHGNKNGGGLGSSKDWRAGFLKPVDLISFIYKCLMLDRFLCRLGAKTTQKLKISTPLFYFSTHAYFLNLGLYIYLSFFKLLKKKEIYKRAGLEQAKTAIHHFYPLVKICSTTFSGFPPVLVGFVCSQFPILIRDLTRKKGKIHHSTGRSAPGPFYCENEA